MIRKYKQTFFTTIKKLKNNLKTLGTQFSKRFYTNCTLNSIRYHTVNII